MMKKTRFQVMLALLLIVTAVAMVVSLIFGGPAGYVLIGSNPFAALVTNDIIALIRLPRVLLAITVGAALAVSGVIYQAVLRNSLAEPYVLGTSSGAAVCTVTAMIAGLSSGFYVGAGIAGAALGTILVLAIARVRGIYPVYRLVVSGIIVHSVCSAVLVILITSFSDRTAGVMYWLMGNLGNKPLSLVACCSAGVLVLSGVVLFRWQELNLLALGEEHALAVGVNVGLYQVFFIAVASLMTGTVVSLSGIIGFIGIIVPHSMRMLIGANHRYLTILSALGGALFLLLADTLARTISAASEVPVGVVTTLTGAPFFLYLLYRQKGELS